MQRTVLSYGQEDLHALIGAEAPLVGRAGMKSVPHGREKRGKDGGHTKAGHTFPTTVLVS